MQNLIETFCARCNKNHVQRATTIAGAIRKATLECNGVIQTSQGPKLTRCATGVSDSLVD